MHLNKCIWLFSTTALNIAGVEGIVEYLNVVKCSLCCDVSESSIKSLHCAKVLNEPKLNTSIDQLTLMSLSKARWDLTGLTGMHSWMQALSRSEWRFFFMMFWSLRQSIFIQNEQEKRFEIPHWVSRMCFMRWLHWPLVVVQKCTAKQGSLLLFMFPLKKGSHK